MHKARTITWKPHYWAYAAGLPLVLSMLDALKLIIYPATRAPNVHYGVQIGLLALTYGVWIFVPRTVWGLGARPALPKKQFALRAFAVGVALSGLHLFIFAFVLRTLYSPPGWGISHLIQSFGEVWLGYIGFWALAYGLTLVIILWAQNHAGPNTTPDLRYELRQNGKIFSILFSDIYWVKAAGNYAELYTGRGTFTVRQTLKQVSLQMPPGLFIPSHRSAIVNSQHVTAIVPHTDTSSYSVLLTGDHHAPLSRRKLAAFKSVLKASP